MPANTDPPPVTLEELIKADVNAHIRDGRPLSMADLARISANAKRTIAGLSRDLYAMPDGDLWANVHPADQCEGTVCVIHNPTDHAMREWPMVLRSNGLVERTCTHGIGHPDPDSVTYFRTVLERDGYGVHGCDGCCHRGTPTPGEVTS